MKSWSCFKIFHSIFLLYTICTSTKYQMMNCSIWNADFVMLTYYILIHIQNDLHFLSHRHTHDKNVALTLCRQRLFFILMTVEWMTHDSNNDNRIKLYWRKLNNGHTKLNHISCHKCMSLNFLFNEFFVTNFSHDMFH